MPVRFFSESLFLLIFFFLIFARNKVTKPLLYFYSNFFYLKLHDNPCLDQYDEALSTWIPILKGDVNDPTFEGMDYVIKVLIE